MLVAARAADHGARAVYAHIRAEARSASSSRARTPRATSRPRDTRAPGRRHAVLQRAGARRCVCPARVCEGDVGGGEGSRAEPSFSKVPRKFAPQTSDGGMERTVLLMGSGFVAQPAAEYILRDKKNKLIVGLSFLFTCP